VPNFQGLWEFARKQAIVSGIATGISLTLVLMACLETRGILPRTTSMTALYASVFLVWPCLAATSGALAFRSNKQPGFAGSVKTGLVSLLAALVLFAVEAYAVLETTARVPAHDMGSILRITMRYLKDTNYILHENGSLFLLGIPMSSVCFSCGTLFSPALSRPRNAAISSYIAGLIISGMLLHSWIRLDLGVQEDDIFLQPHYWNSIFLVLESLAILLFLFALILQAPRRASLLLRAVLAAGLPTIIFFAFAYPHTRQFSPDSAVLFSDPRLTSDGKYILADVKDGSRNSLDPRIWRISVSDGHIAQLTDRLAYNAAISPEGEWVAYLSQRSAIGLAQDSIDLRAVRIDGTGDHLLASDVAESWYFNRNTCGDLFFSPDGNRIALMCNGSLTVADMRHAHTNRMDIPKSWRRAVAGWNSSGTEILIAPKMPPGPLLACDPSNNQIRVAIDNTLERRNFVIPTATKGIQNVLLGDVLLDITRGNVRKVAKSNFYLAGISADGSTLAYLEAEVDPFNHQSGEIHWFELSTGSNHAALSFAQGCAEAPFLVSPNGDRLVLWDCAEGGQSAVIDRAGTVRYFPSEWRAFGWLGNHEVALFKFGSSVPLAIGNTSNLSLKILRP